MPATSSIQLYRDGGQGRKPGLAIVQVWTSATTEGGLCPDDLPTRLTTRSNPLNLAHIAITRKVELSEQASFVFRRLQARAPCFHQRFDSPVQSTSRRAQRTSARYSSSSAFAPTTSSSPAIASNVCEQCEPHASMSAENSPEHRGEIARRPLRPLHSLCIADVGIAAIPNVVA
ncbi:bglB [Symbiodinium microadriaticum]|nr:bglB [Symbiodinium microadriaticum]